MKPDFIETYTGLAFRPLAPEVDKIRIADIAHSLSLEPRFNGHSREPYYVAEHSVRVSRLLKEWGCSTPVQFWGLMHDATEAYLRDLSATLKHLPEFAFYRQAEERLMLAICERFGLSPTQPARVKKADQVLLATEARDLMAFRSEHWGELKEVPLEERITPWSSREAERTFLHRFAELSGRM
jgi:hypothetical protein